MSTCNKCNRELSDPISIARGFGPICWAHTIKNTHKEGETLFGHASTLAPNRAHFTWGISDGVLWLVDEGNGKICHSLTNDIEAAIASILPSMSLVENQHLMTLPIIYRDSQGDWDGIKIERFDLKQAAADALWLQPKQKQSAFYQPRGIECDFFHAGGSTRDEAIQRIKAKGHA